MKREQVVGSEYRTKCKSEDRRTIEGCNPAAVCKFVEVLQILHKTVLQVRTSQPATKSPRRRTVAMREWKGNHPQKILPECRYFVDLKVASREGIGTSLILAPAPVFFTDFNHTIACAETHEGAYQQEAILIRRN